MNRAKGDCFCSGHYSRVLYGTGGTLNPGQKRKAIYELDEQISVRLQSVARHDVRSSIWRSRILNWPVRRHCLANLRKSSRRPLSGFSSTA